MDDLNLTLSKITTPCSFVCTTSARTPVNNEKIANMKTVRQLILRVGTPLLVTVPSFKSFS